MIVEGRKHPELLDGFRRGMLQPRMADIVAAFERGKETANITLEIGAASTTVDVVVSGATIDTTTAQIQSTYTRTQITDLPMSSAGVPGASFGALNLSLLSAGVTSSGGVGAGIGPSVGGQRPTQQQLYDRGHGQQSERCDRARGLCSK